MKRITLLSSLAAYGGLSLARAKAAGATTVRISIAGPKSHSYYAGAVKFKEVLERESDGRIKVDIFPNSELGDEMASLELVRRGALQFAEHLTSIAATAYHQPALEAWALPFLYPNAQAAYRAWDSSVAAQSYGAFEKSGFKCIALWDAGFRELSSDRPVDSPADLKGLKVRTPAGKIYIDTWKALGAVPVPLPITQLYTALETGVVNGTELPIDAVVAQKYYEVQKDEALLNYMNDPICLSVSLQYYNSLSPALRKAVDQAAAASARAEREASLTQSNAAVAQLEKFGIKVTQPSLGAFRSAVAPVYGEFYKSAGPSGRSLVQRIRQAMAH